jgi:hypothetical protein
MASRSVRILDEMGSQDLVVELLKAAIYGDNAGAPTHMVVHPGPMSNAAWASLSDKAPVVQVSGSVCVLGGLCVAS